MSATAANLEVAMLRQRFLARARAETLTVAELCEGVMRAPRARRRAPLESVASLLHRLAGTSGTLGFAALGDLARLLERVCLTMLRYPEEGFSARLLELSEGATELLRIIDAELPAVATLARATSPPSRREAGEAPRVHLVSMQPALARTLHAALAGLGYEVREFEDVGSVAAAKEYVADAAAFVVQPGTGARALAELARLRVALRHPAPILVIGAQAGFGDYLASVRAAADGYFPLPLDLPRLESRLRALIEREHGEALRVLMIDDDSDFLAACRGILEEAGMQVRALEDPSRVLPLLYEFRPEVVLADIQMPQCTGPELAQVIRMHDDWTHVPIVYVSGASAGADQLLATRNAGEAFVPKPVDPHELVATVRANGRRARQIAEAVSRDGLTGVLKRSFIQEYLLAALERAQRTGSTTSVAMIDIDHFKLVNDTHGHPVGDLVIRTLAAALRQRLRGSDGLGRVGGEEFLAVLPDCSAEEAKALLGGALQRFREISYSSEAGDFSCSFSAGIAEARGGSLSDAQLVALADQALYSAKRGGRNRIHRARPRVRPAAASRGPAPTRPGDSAPVRAASTRSEGSARP
jgi:diguanylate cyclase (GGDEF)-like protein